MSHSKCCFVGVKGIVGERVSILGCYDYYYAVN